MTHPRWKSIYPAFAAGSCLPRIAGVAFVAGLICSMASTGCAGKGGDMGPVAGPDAPPAPRSTVAPRPRFTLRLGQGFVFADAVVVGKQDERADVVFKYLPPQVGGMALRYNPISQQVEQGLEPNLTAPVPLLVGSRIQSFETLPDLGRITSGDVATYGPNGPVGAKTRFMLLQSRTGEHFLLTLDELDAVAGRYDDWRIGFTWEKVEPPPGLAGGKVNPRLPGTLVFRDYCRTKMIVQVDLTTGKETALADGTLPSVGGDRLLGYGDTTGAYVVRGPSGAVLATIRLNEQVLGPVLSPDGNGFAGSVYRPGPPTVIGGVSLPSAPVLAVAVFDLGGREVIAVPGYDDAAWTPDGKLIATGALTGPGLFEIDPRTKDVRAIDARIGAAYQPSVSPDGRTIAFVTGDRVWLIERDGTGLRQLLPHGMKQQRPEFSPDGRMVAAVICNQLGNDMTGEVFVVDRKTQEVTTLRTSTGLGLLPDTSTRLCWRR